MQIAEAFVALRPDSSKFEGDAQKQLGAPLKNLAAGAASAFAAVKVKDLFSGFIEEAREAERVGRLTNAALESTGGVANVSADDIDKLAEKLSKVAGVDDDLIQSGENLLLTFTNIRNEVGEGNNIFDQATEAALNMSAALGTDLQGNITLVGKALNDPIAGLSALSRAGVQLTADQKEQIKGFVAVGDTLSAQKILLGELETQFGGAASAAADPAQKLSVAWGNLQEQLGTEILPAFNGLVDVVGQGVDLFGNLPGPVQTGTVALAGMAAVSGPLLTVGGNLKTIAEGAAAIPGKVGDAASSLKGMGASGLALGGVVGIIAGIGIAAAATAESLDSKLGKVIDEVSAKSDKDLVEAFDKGGRSLRDFEIIADKNVGTAIRLRDELKDQGADTKDLDKVVNEHVTAQKNAEKSTDAARKAVEKETDAVGELTPTVEDATEALDKLLDATTALFDADLSYEEQVNNVEDALTDLNAKTAEVMKTKGKDKKATEDMERATIDAAGAIVDLGNKAVDAAEQQAALSGKTLDAGEKARIQKAELEKVRDTLAPGSALRQRLDQYIYMLAQIPSKVSTTVEQTFVVRGNPGQAPIRVKSLDGDKDKRDAFNGNAAGPRLLDKEFVQVDTPYGEMTLPADAWIKENGVTRRAGGVVNNNLIVHTTQPVNAKEQFRRMALLKPATRGK